MFINRLLISGNLSVKRFIGKDLSGKKLLVGDEIIISRSRLPPKLFYNQFRSKKGKLELIELDENEIRDGSKLGIKCNASQRDIKLPITHGIFRTANQLSSIRCSE